MSLHQRFSTLAWTGYWAELLFKVIVEQLWAISRLQTLTLLMTLPFYLSLETLVAALEAFINEAKPLGLEVSWTKTKVQEFGDLLEPVQSVHACGEDIEVTESFTYLGSVVHNWAVRP